MNRIEVWLHIPTMTTACVTGDFGEFELNGLKEESFWGLFRDQDHGWVYITNL